MGDVFFFLDVCLVAGPKAPFYRFWGQPLALPLGNFVAVEPNLIGLAVSSHSATKAEKHNLSPSHNSSCFILGIGRVTEKVTSSVVLSYHPTNTALSLNAIPQVILKHHQWHF